MLVPRLAEARRALTAHHIAGLLLSLAFPVAKWISPICEILFAYTDECGVDSREREILMFLAVIIMWKGRKATNWLHYVSNIFLFSKLANMFLFLRADPLLGIIYVVLCVLQSVLLPEPVYNGPEKVTYFQGPELFEELSRDRRTTWVIQFYATWSPDCKHVAPVFAQLSERFTLSNMRFGKLDVGRWPAEAERFRVNAHPTSRQLPTIAVFKDAHEVRRRPVVNEKRRAVPFVFNEENCIRDLDLMNLHKEARDSMSGKEKKLLEQMKKSE